MSRRASRSFILFADCMFVPFPAVGRQSSGGALIGCTDRNDSPCPAGEIGCSNRSIQPFSTPKKCNLSVRGISRIIVPPYQASPTEGAAKGAFRYSSPRGYSSIRLDFRVGKASCAGLRSKAGSLGTRSNRHQGSMGRDEPVEIASLCSCAHNFDQQTSLACEFDLAVQLQETSCRGRLAPSRPVHRGLRSG